VSRPFARPCGPAVARRAHDQRDQDPKSQYPLLELGGNRERRHDHDEDEQIVDREALLDDVAREVLDAVVPTRHEPEHDAEQHRHGDVEDGAKTASSKPTACACPGRETNRSRTKSAAIAPIVAAHPAKLTSSIIRHGSPMRRRRAVPCTENHQTDLLEMTHRASTASMQVVGEPT
jgi:hypothetical protein